MSATAQPTEKTGAATAEHARADFVDVSIVDLERGGGKNIRDLNPEKVGEIAASITSVGILEPVLIRREGGKSILVDGAHRVAAAKSAGHKTVPARVLRIEPKTVLEVQLIANLQREDLQPLDEARAMKAYLEATGSTQEQLAKRIGKSQPYVAKRIGLLALPDRGVKLIESGKLPPSAAVHLVSLPADAKRETSRVIADLERTAQYRGAVTNDEARYAVEGAMRQYRERQKKQKQVAAAKFPACPVKSCLRAGRPPAEWQGTKDFSCSRGHSWDPTSGKITARESRRPSHSAPPAPTLPLVDPRVPITVPPSRVVNRILGAMKTVQTLTLRWDEKGSRGMLEIHVDLPALRAAQLPGVRVDEHHKFLELEDCEEWYQRDDGGRKRAAKVRADLEAWLSTIGHGKTKAA
jgi:ParB/RepB/Spo0J family partition protein